MDRGDTGSGNFPLPGARAIAAMSAVPFARFGTRV